MRFEVISGGVSVLPGLEVSVPPELRVVNGEFPFKLAADKPQERVLVKVTLIDSELQESKPREFQFRAKDPFTAPKITLICFPPDCSGKFPADGNPKSGTVGFKDPGGDVDLALFEVVGEARDLTVQIGERRCKERSCQFPLEVRGRTEGVFGFALSTTTAQQGKLKLILVDAKGKTSQPQELSRRPWGRLRVFKSIPRASASAPPSAVLILQPRL